MSVKLLLGPRRANVIPLPAGAVRRRLTERNELPPRKPRKENRSRDVGAQGHRPVGSAAEREDEQTRAFVLPECFLNTVLLNI